jgi:DnaJ-class molecular chaperone
MPLEKTIMGGRFDPDSYGMLYCPVCKGSGRLFNGVEGRVVCKICGGFGFIKKEKENNFDGHGHRVQSEPNWVESRES